MATLASIVHAGKGVAGPWAIVPGEDPARPGTDVLALRHYSTIMLAWVPAEDNRIIYLSTGHGSVSDQNGVNKALRVLGGWYNPSNGWNGPVPGTPGPAMYFSRAGGSTYHVLDERYSLVPIRGGLSSAYELLRRERDSAED